MPPSDATSAKSDDEGKKFRSFTTTSTSTPSTTKLPPYPVLCLQTQDLFDDIQQLLQHSYYPVLDEWNSEDLFSLLYTTKTTYASKTS